MPIFKIQHITRYAYDRPVTESANQIKIFPYNRPGQETTSHELVISGEPAVHKFTDYFGNLTGWIMLADPHRELSIESRLVVRSTHDKAIPSVHSKLTDWEALAPEITRDIRLLDLSKPESGLVKQQIAPIVESLRPRADPPALFIQRCSEYIYEQFIYQKGITNVETTVAEILDLKTGVCQDFAHVLLEMLRAGGIPARYVSGYVCPNRSGLRGAGATHAWVEAWLPGDGWVGIDPTNNVWVSDLHITLAVGRHFRDCTPVKGVFKGPANQELSVYVSVGFEDGSKFEDSNTVQLNREPIAAPVPEAQYMQQQ
jgi:transglutaminase-like putative cysteine protease